MNKPGRNDPCPCGSGKKYKSCCMNVQQEPKKTYTPSGKRKFKAKVIDANTSQSIFSKSGAGAPTAEGNPEVLQALRFRMSGHDYRPDETEESSVIPQPTEVAPIQAPETEHKPGQLFEIASENFQVEEK